ncbi:MAG TPA: winged helix-turn-helix domain-containing protein [bacterium]|nr:winged helix-turn-helix domain-containing protein [bacterium]
MSWRFADFELDEERRELRLRGREVVLQPRVMDVLLYLVRNRERVVPKDELLDRLWPGTVVTESSLQRAVSLARSALRAGEAADAIRSYPRRGYRFCADVTASGPSEPPTGRPEIPPALADARTAFETADWEGALELLARVDREDALTGADLERWAHCFLNLGRPAEAVPSLERAVAAHSSAGDARGAARSAVLLCQIHLEGRRPKVAKGWHGRALRLLGDAEPCRELALAEWMAGRLAIADGDHVTAAERFQRALEVAGELEDLDVEAVSLVYLGHALIAQDRTRQWLARQDEAAAAVLGGEVSPWYAGLVYCGLIYVCQNRGDWSRASEWTESFSTWQERCPTSTFPALCRLHRAEVLTVRGELDQAERDIRDTRAELIESAPYAEGDAERLLGDVHLARGDLDRAERAYRRAYALGWDPCPGWAYLHAERGDLDGGIRALERALEDTGWPCHQRRRLLLAALARVEAAAGQPERARAAIREAEGAEDRDLSPAQRGALDRARGELAFAEGRTDEAIATLRTAVRLWQELNCPMEVAALRFRMAELLHASGDDEGAELELAAAEEALRRTDAEGRREACVAFRERLAR